MTNCPQHNILLNHWQGKMTEIDTLYQEFKGTGKQEIKERIEKLKKKLKLPKKNTKILSTNRLNLTVKKSKE
jgi:hypothetical protein